MTDSQAPPETVFPIWKVNQDKAVDTRTARPFRVALSQNLFPIGFSRNFRSDMGKRELAERSERPNEA
jgi:hypothetical protein